MNKTSESKKAIYAALVGNLLICAFKFFAAAETGSSAMLSEGIHSLIDTLDEILLIVGQRRSKKPPTSEHPFGHGLELYFWSFIVAILIFSVGGGVSIYEGLHQYWHPRDLKNIHWNYAVLGFSFVTEGISLIISLKAFSKTKKNRSFWVAVQREKDPTVFTVVFEDSAALLGLIIAAVAIYLSQLLNKPYLDAIGSILIGLLLIGVSIVLARESKNLLIGESAYQSVIDGLNSLLEHEPSLSEVKKIRTLQIGPQTIMVVAQVVFKNTLSSQETAAAALRIKTEAKKRFPGIKYFFVDIQLAQNGPSADLRTPPF